MEAPSPLDVDFVQRRNTQPTGDFDSRPLGAEPTLLPHKNELNIGISESMASKGTITSPKERAVIYQFGDGGSTWRMNKLRNVYRHADESQRAVDDVALERYGDMRDFDDAREEEVEMDRRKLYGKGYVGKEKPTGDLFTQRLSEEKKKSTMTESSTDRANEITDSQILQGQADDGALVSAKSSVLDKTTLNKLKAQLMRARLRGEPEVGKLQEAFDAAMIASASTRDEPGIVVLNAMENRMLASGRNGEVKAVENTRGRERGLVEENENMSIEDMVRQERRTRGQPNGEGRFLAERIAKDAKFDVSNCLIQKPNKHLN